MLNLSVAILAGGLGTRLNSVIADRPKALAPIQGRPFLSFLLDQLVLYDLRQVVLCTGYLSAQIRETFGENYRSLTLRYSTEPAPLGTGGALRLAVPYFKFENVLVMNGDSFCELDLRAGYAWHQTQAAKATIALVHLPDTSRYGQVQINDEKCVTQFEEKKSTLSAGWINSGIYVINKSLIESIPDNRPVSLERETFPAWIGHGFYGWQSAGRFIDIGTPESYSFAEKFFKP